MLGIVWFLMGLGAFTKDVAHLMVSIVPIMMFATPIFYTLDQLPPRFAPWMKLNIIGDYVEMLRQLIILGELPSPIMYLACIIVSYAVFILGYRFFMRYKSVIVDVI
jgi:lipopolysaccharide transport system permease protein